MNRTFQNLCYFISAVSVLGGLADIAVQFFEGQELSWNAPLIHIGIGVGLPIIIFPFYTPAPPKDDSRVYDDNDVSSAYPDEEGFLSRSNSGGSKSDYDNYDGADVSDGSD
ncbi:hypothetical protein [Paraglaciecola sp. 25GB23A]|uniref:hypothetical protein n=1 Tax=Paraglaciecola sp. 25GB23A TaxID=3156068 RepID=UPI0032AF4DD1